VFAGRCAEATAVCKAAAPALEEKAVGHLVACHYAEREAVPA
jgi:peptide/nickel transport system ATP-binding protein